MASSEAIADLLPESRVPVAGRNAAFATALPTVPDPEPIRVYLLDDQAVVREAISIALGEVAGLEVVGQASRTAGVVARVLSSGAEVVLLEARFVDGSGVEVCREIRAADPRVHCLILTGSDDREIALAAMLAGASGYLLKSISMRDLADAIQQAARGVTLADPDVIAEMVERVSVGEDEEPWLDHLTNRKRAILDLIAEGLTNREIGRRIGLSEKTVKNYVSAVLHKLGLQRRTQAAVLIVEAGHAIRPDAPNALGARPDDRTVARIPLAHLPGACRDASRLNDRRA